MRWNQVLIFQGVQDSLRVLIYLLPQFLPGVLFPSLRFNLLRRIRPEITVLEVQHEIHPGIDCTVRQFYSRGDIICSAAIGNTVIRIWIHPEAEAYQIGSTGLQQLEQVCLPAVKEIFRSKALQSFCEGNIHSFVKTHFSPLINNLFFSR